MRKQTIKLICTIMAGTLMLPAAAVSVSADQLLIAPAPTAAAQTAQGFCGFHATWKLEGGVLTVDGSGAIDNYELNSAPWSGKVFDSVIISEGITSIGNYAFSGCEMTSVSIPSSVNSIGIGAFKDCPEIVDVVVPAGVTAIRNLTFAGCEKLVSVSLPGGVTRIGNMAFEGCSSLASVNIPDSVTELGSAAFNECSSLTDIVIPESVTELTYNVFGYCTSLANVTIPATVKKINKYAFDGCEQLVITGAFNSHAHAYALEHDLAFKQTGTLDVTDVNYAWKNPFKDIKESAWYYEGVKYVNVYGIMQGMSADTFSPTTTLTRAQFVTMLYRVEGEPSVGSSSFTDVEDGCWYDKAVAWASSKGIVNGVSATEFAPTVEITNEQMAAIMYRYAKAKGYDTAVSGELTYTDKRSVSDYAKDAVIWMNSKGIMMGNNDGTFTPSVSATRGQAADVFARFMSQFK